jgi:hypothetical protein
MLSDWVLLVLFSPSKLLVSCFPLNRFVTGARARIRNDLDSSVLGGFGLTGGLGGLSADIHNSSLDETFVGGMTDICCESAAAGDLEVRCWRFAEFRYFTASPSSSFSSLLLLSDEEDDSLELISVSEADDTCRCTPVGDSGCSQQAFTASDVDLFVSVLFWFGKDTFL